MIRSEKEYNRALNRLEEEQNVIARQRSHFKELGHTGEELPSSPLKDWTQIKPGKFIICNYVNTQNNLE